MFQSKKQNGVSPVIGIILMVAVTVGLVALASTIVFDLGSNVNEPADVSGSVTLDESANEITADVVRNENAQSVSVRWDTSSDEAIDFEIAGSVGATGTVTLSKYEICQGTMAMGMGKSFDSTGTGTSGVAELVANVGTEDNEQIVDSVEYEGECSN